MAGVLKFKIVFKNGPDAGESAVTARSRFWRGAGLATDHVTERDDNVQENDDPLRRFEREFDKGMGPAIERQLRDKATPPNWREQFLHELAWMDSRQKPDVLRLLLDARVREQAAWVERPGVADSIARWTAMNSVAARAKIVRYGSMIAEVELAGKVWEAVGGDFDLLTMLLETCMHPAFAEIYSGSFAAGVSIEVSPSWDARDNFRRMAPSRGTSLTDASENAGNRAKRLWAAIQISFLVPVLLTLASLWGIGQWGLQLLEQQRRAVETLLDGMPQRVDADEQRKLDKSQSEPNGPPPNSLDSQGPTW